MIQVLITSLIFLTQEPSKVISGRVLSYEDSVPLWGATILIDGTNIGIQTDSLGYFELPFEYGNDRIQISYVGHCNTIVKLPSKENDIELGEINLFWNYNRTLIVESNIKKKWPAKWFSGKKFMTSNIYADSVKHKKYRSRTISKECFSYENQMFKYQPINVEGVKLDLTQPTICN